MSELLPCPFCGCAMRIHTNRDWHELEGDHASDCILETAHQYEPATDDHRALLVAAWNRRSPAGAPAGALSTEDQQILEAVWREMDEADRGNAPGHAHSVPGIWDDDNKPEIAGKPCAWCITWRKFTALIDRAPASSVSGENAPGDGGMKE